jgi:hypothetical protein
MYCAGVKFSASAGEEGLKGKYIFPITPPITKLI